MSDSFTTLWNQERCRTVRQHGLEGTRLTILFGGPHTSLPSFRRYGVQSGDWVYPVCVHAGVLYVIGRIRVREILPLGAYIERNPAMFESYRTEWPSVTLQNYIVDHPEQRYLAPTCVDEVVIGSDGTAIRLDNSIAPEIVERLRFRSRRRERGLKYLEQGRLSARSIVGLQGVYRLTESSAEELAALLSY